MRLHIVAGLLGPAETAPLTDALQARGCDVSHEPYTCPGAAVWTALTAEYLAHDRADSRDKRWDLVVGVQEGAGFACEIAADIKAPVVLLDPERAILAERAPESLRAYTEEYWNHASLLSEALEPYAAELSSGQLSDSALYHLFGGPSWSAKTRGMLAVALFSGRVFLPGFRADLRAARVGDWFDAWTTAKNAVQIWLPTPVQSLAPALRSYGIVEALDSAVPWLDDPEGLAERLVNFMTTPR